MSAFEILLPLALILSLTKLLGLGSQKVGLPAVIGMLIASWMACGTVPYIIYLGLGLLNPSWYLPFIVIMCSVLSSITGSS